MSRRGFAWAGAAVVSGVGAWAWLNTRSEDDGLSWPFRRVLRLNEALSRATFERTRLAPEFPRRDARAPRVNGAIGSNSELDPVSWRLRMTAPFSQKRESPLTLAEVQAFPRVEQTTELKCIEGWSTVVHWAGARLADVAASSGLATRSGRRFSPRATPGDLFDYVALATPDGEYYVGLDVGSALHPQTLLAYEMNGRPLTPGHGAPLRLVIPVKYGIKNLKQVGTITFTDRRPADYWAEQGYDWYAGM
jgi:DMSO/TMAO reductase YedYZ molybdopterin-dependent catalytic subunit